MTIPATNLTPAAQELTPPQWNVPGRIISSSGNIQAALSMIVDYLQSTYDLQAADTLLEQGITNAEATLVQQFEAGLTTYGSGRYDPTQTNYIWQLEHVTDNNQISVLTQLYTNANMANQATTKIMDGNNSTAQNTLSQNSQGQQGLMQTMSAINQQEANMARNIQG